mmetsp:Transcript_23156/g.53716  ORF Transcript_23156/g.53716 Transcript_23156/m.53716 type:complete len:261 (-) Transcript_23156:37-819(-)
MFLPSVQNLCHFFRRREIGVDKIQKMFSRVGVGWERVSNAIKVGRCVLGVSRECFSSLGQDHYLIESIVYLGRRLVDSAGNDKILFLRDTKDLLHNVGSRSRIQPTGRFVKKEYGGLLEQRDGKGETAALPTTQPGASCICTTDKAHFGDDIVDNDDNIAPLSHVVELCCIHERFTSREVRPMLILLLHNWAKAEMKWNRGVNTRESPTMRDFSCTQKVHTKAMFLEDLVSDWSTIERNRTGRLPVECIQGKSPDQCSLQ